MSEVALVFLAIAALTFVGFGAGRFFERTRFPDILLLLGLGLILGPVNRLAVQRGWGSTVVAAAFDPDTLEAATPYIAALALVVLLFDSGLELDFSAFRRSIAPAAAHTLPIYVLTVAGVASAGNLLFGMPWPVGLALGVACTNVDQAVSSGILRHLRIGEAERSVYFVEMAFYDLLSIPILIAIIQGSQGFAAAAGAGTALKALASLLSVSVAVGLAAGLPWIFALGRLRTGSYAYMLTFAMTLAVYGVSEVLGGAGAVSILLFGLLVGNRTAILRRFAHVRNVDLEHERVQTFHGEIAFFVRTVFFLYLGLSFHVGLASVWPVASKMVGLRQLGAGELFAVAIVTLVAVIIAARLISVRLMARNRPARRALFPVFGRGLDTAVLVTLPFLAAGYTPGSVYYNLFSPWRAVFVDIALMVIILTVVSSSILVFLQERRLGPAPIASNASDARDELAVPLGRTPRAPGAQAAAGKPAARSERKSEPGAGAKAAPGRRESAGPRRGP